MGQRKQTKPKEVENEIEPTKRYQIRCKVADLARWEARARELGYASAGAWIQRVANEALKSAA